MNLAKLQERSLEIAGSQDFNGQACIQTDYPVHEGQQVGKVDFYPVPIMSPFVTITEWQLKQIVKQAIKEVLEEYNKE